MNVLHGPSDSLFLFQGRPHSAPPDPVSNLELAHPLDTEAKYSVKFGLRCVLPQLVTVRKGQRNPASFPLGRTRPRLSAI